MLQTRFIEPKDIKTTNQWLVGWNMQALDESIFPTTGLVLYDENEDIYTGYVWMSNSKLAHIGFITRNPFYRNKKTINEQTRISFIDALISYARELGYTHAITWAENKFLVNDFKKLGFTETSQQCSELIVKL